MEYNDTYKQLLLATAKLSRLFSDNNAPYLSSRALENIFCYAFGAQNLSRADTAFDAKFNGVGIGLKTFLSEDKPTMQKIAEFNKLAKELASIEGVNLARKLGELRNERIKLTERTYCISQYLYHVVSRNEGQLVLFECSYDLIDVPSITEISKTPSGIKFRDKHSYYSFNKSKSTLFKQFKIPDKRVILSIQILDNPYELLLKILPSVVPVSKKNQYVILPLYSTRTKKIEPKSGLNQWNASGRHRNKGEVYIPIPQEIHKKFPDFFPSKDSPFNLQVPTGETLRAKVCQENGKALMTNPNKSLSDWLLRRVLGLNEGALATIEHLDKLGFDSVIITKSDQSTFSIDIRPTGSYEKFLERSLVQ